MSAIFCILFAVKWDLGKFRCYHDPGKMEFGGNQGVVNDSIKIHEQQICSKVRGCDDLNHEKNIRL